MDQPQVIVIIGANRGIGAQLTSRFLQKDYTVYGTYRSSSKNDSSVKSLGETGAHMIELDVTDEESIARAAKLFDGSRIDILVNVAGIYNLWDEKAFDDHTAEDLMRFFQVNVVAGVALCWHRHEGGISSFNKYANVLNKGPFLTSKHLLPALSRGKLGKIINISSDMASILDNLGGNACYRISKCAVNQLTKTQSVDLIKRGYTIQTLAVHPGFVATKMTGFYGEDDMEECMAGLVSLIERFGQKGEEDKLKNGGYYRWNGDPMQY